MRKELAKETGQRKKFQAVFIRLGKKVSYQGYSEDTILLRGIKDVASNKLVADHIWFTFSKGFEKIKLAEGVSIEFEARVKEYRKGYVNSSLGINKRSVDFKLSHPTRIKVIGADHALKTTE